MHDTTFPLCLYSTDGSPWERVAVQGAWPCQMVPSSQGTRTQPVPKPCLVLIAAQPLQTGSAERPHSRGHPRRAGKRGNTSRMASKVTSKHSLCPYPTDFFFLFCLFYEKDQKLNIVPWSMKDISETTEGPPPHVDLIKEKRDLKQKFGSDHPNLWQGLET